MHFEILILGLQVRIPWFIYQEAEMLGSVRFSRYDNIKHYIWSKSRLPKFGLVENAYLCEKPIKQRFYPD